MAFYRVGILTSVFSLFISFAKKKKITLLNNKFAKGGKLELDCLKSGFYLRFSCEKKRMVQFFPQLGIFFRKSFNC